MAQSRHAQCADECPLLGTKRTVTNRVHDDPSGEPALSQGLPSEAEPRRENLGSRRGDKFLLAIPPRAAPAACAFSRVITIGGRRETIGARYGKTTSRRQTDDRR